MCCGFWESKVLSVLQQLGEETFTFLVAGRVLRGDRWEWFSSSAATHEEGHWPVLVSLISTLESREKREKPSIWFALLDQSIPEEKHLQVFHLAELILPFTAGMRCLVSLLNAIKKGLKFMC